jgi:acid phosphatase
LAEAPLGCPMPDGKYVFNAVNPNLGELKLWLRHYRCTKYDLDVAQKLAEARAWIEQHAEEFEKPAIVLDIDETSLSNWEVIYRNDFAYISAGGCDQDVHSACGQRAWELSARAVAIEPTLALFNAAKARSIAVFFITGRPEDPVLRTATEENLHKAGYHDWNELYLRPRSIDSKEVAKYKTATRAGIEDAGYTIIANVGDQDSDLADGYAEKTFKVPNPFYFIP